MSVLCGVQLNTEITLSVLFRIQSEDSGKFQSISIKLFICSLHSLCVKEKRLIK
jgi:hypothetical protein